MLKATGRVDSVIVKKAKGISGFKRSSSFNDLDKNG